MGSDTATKKADILDDVSEEDIKIAERIQKERKSEIDAALARSEESYRKHGGIPADEVFDEIIDGIKKRNGL